jgi:hypothetical protein
MSNNNTTTNCNHIYSVDLLYIITSSNTFMSSYFTYIYIYMCVCVCVCIQGGSNMTGTDCV